MNASPADQRRLLEVAELDTRIRDVTQGPDEKIYLLTDEKNGKVLRLEPRT